MRPDDRRYRDSHEWAKPEGDLVAIGITDHAVEQLGDLTFLEIKVAAGDEISQGDLLAEIESVKTVADIYAPIDGEIVAIHEELGDDVEPLGENPFENGWIVRLKPTDPSALEDLLDADAYEKVVSEG